VSLGQVTERRVVQGTLLEQLMIVTHVIIVFSGHKMTDVFVIEKMIMGVIVTETYWNGTEGKCVTGRR
jgi:hypothetical protein